jgi:glycosyltransferase involved in cell wall biosynthesis
LGSPGIGRTAWHQVDELARAGHQVRVVTTRLAVDAPPGVSVRTTLPTAAGRAVGKLLGVDRAMSINDAATARVLARSARQTDVVHTWPAGGLRTIRAAARHGVAAVRELPNTHTEHAYAAANRAAEDVGIRLDGRNPHSFRGERLARETREYAEATALLAPSDVVARTFIDRGHPAERVLRHRYGFDPRRLRFEDAAARVASTGALRALFVGRAEPRKGLHLALRAWHASAASAGGRFTICGTFVPGYREALGALLHHPGVDVVGFVPDPARLYAEHDVLLLPSVEEGSALVTYEASAMGCLPLISDAAGAQYQPGITALVHPAGDWDQLRRHLDGLVADPGALARMQQACLAGRDELTWAAAVALTAQAYRAAIALRPEPHAVRG